MELGEQCQAVSKFNLRVCPVHSIRVLLCNLCAPREHVLTSDQRERFRSLMTTFLVKGRIVVRWKRAIVLGSCVCSLISSGCITISAPSFTGTGKKSNVQQVAYEEVVEEAPPDPKDPTRLSLKYARWMEEVNQVVEARKHYNVVVESEPENVEAILGLARLDQVTGQAAEAEQKFKKAVRLSGSSPESLYGLGQFYASQERWSEAVEPLNAAMLAAPENTTYRYHLAIALVHNLDIEAAMPHLIRTVGDAEGHYNIGLILHKMDRLEEAEKHFVLAVTKKPELEQAQKWISKLREQRAGGGHVRIDQPSVGQLPSFPPRQSASQMDASPAELAAWQSDHTLSPQQREQLLNQVSPSSL